MSLLLGLDALEAHMKKEYSHENLAFYRDVRDFRRKYNSTVEIRTSELIADAKKLFDDYVAESAPHQINLPAEAIAALQKTFTDTVSRCYLCYTHFCTSYCVLIKTKFGTDWGMSAISQLRLI